MTQATATVNSFMTRIPKPEKMVTLACGTCRMALYMPERELQMPTWQCPSCGTITKS